MNRYLLSICISLAALSLALPATAQEVSQKTPTPVSSSAEQTPAEASVPNPEISDEEFYARTLIFSVGSQHLYQKLQALLLESEIQRRNNAGISFEFAEVADLDVDNRIDKITAVFLDQNPDLDFWVQIRDIGYTEESYRVEIRRQILLERLFFPPNPEDWPMDLLKEVFGGDVEGSVWNLTVKGMPAKLIEKGEPYDVDPNFMQYLLTPTVFRWMVDNAEIAYPFDGIKEGVCLVVNGLEVPTSQIIQRITPMLSDVDEERAATWVKLCKALKEDLAKKGILLTEAETQAIIDEEKKEYANSGFTYEQIIMEGLGFPTMEMFLQYKQLRLSFRQTIAYPLPHEVVANHLKERRQFIASGQVKAEAILFAAKDLDTGSWPKTGSFEAAKTRSELAVQALLDGKPFHQVLPQYSEYPEEVRGGAAGSGLNRGRFGSLQRNQLRQLLGESEFTDFMTGVSIGDELFFDAEVDAVYGPRKGPLGYYLYRLINRSEPTVQVDFEGDERHTTFVQDDHLSVKFLAYIAEITGR